jgi:hypothetical protein
MGKHFNNLNPYIFCESFEFTYLHFFNGLEL